MVIKNVKIRTMAQRDFERGFVRISGGVFTEIGEMSQYSETEDEIIDGEGLTMYPGLIGRAHV